MGTVNNNFLPNSTGLDLGSSGQRWDVNAQDIDVSRNLSVGGTATLSGSISSTGAATFSDLRAKGNPWYDVKAYGAVCDGVADDTAALQAVLNIVDQETGGVMFIPRGKCRITSTLTIPNTTGGFAIVGLGPGISTIEMDASNKPIFLFSGQYMHDVRVQGLSLGFTAAQSSSNTESICIKVGDGGATNQALYLSHLNNLTFYNAFRGIQCIANGTIWGTEISFIWGKDSLSGATIWHVPTMVGAVRNTFHHIYNVQTITEPQTRIESSLGCSLENWESNSGQNNVLYLGSFEGSIRDLNIEGLTLSTASIAAVKILTSRVHWNGLWVQNNCTVNVGGGNTAYLISDHNAQSYITLDRVHVNSVTLTSGSLYLAHTLFQPSAGAAMWDVGKNLKLDNISAFSATDPAILYNVVVKDGVSQYVNPVGGAYATVGGNVNSNPSYEQGSYWNGSAAGRDIWTRSVVLGSGTNPTSTYTLAHSGSSGAATVSVPALSASDKFSVDANGVITKYNSTATAGAGAAAIFAQVNAVNQTAAITSTNLLASVGAGIYRVTYVHEITQAATTSSATQLTIGWNNGYSAQTKTGTNLTGNTLTTFDQGSFLINAAAATNITYAATYSSTGASVMNFGLSLRLEKL